MYLLVRPCEKCGAGPLEEASRSKADSATGGIDLLQTRCSSCGKETTLRFSKPGSVKLTAVSELIDVTEWLGLCHYFLDEAQVDSDSSVARQQIISARYCLNEALKFYSEDSDLPAASAFFGPLGEQRFKEHPATFAKDKLLELRRRLPVLSSEVSKQGAAGTRKKAKWWRNDT